MKKAVRRYVLRLAIGLSGAFMISFVVVSVSQNMWSRAEGLNGYPLWSLITLVHGIVVGFPFATLALLGVSARRAWAAGCVVTVIIWGYYLRTTLSGYADHGLGPVMFLSPVPVLGSSLLALLTLADGRPADRISEPNGPW
jgi:hypothetical protein